MSEIKSKENLGTITFFCDESCHLDNTNSRFMSIAAVYCRKDRKKVITNEINKIKEKYKISASTEIKWNKVSPASLEMYKEIFTTIKTYNFLKIRIVVSNKTKIKKDAQYRWYDTMYYKLLEFPMQLILWNYKLNEVDIYSDIKDSNSYENMNKVCDFLYKHFRKKTDNVPKFNSKVCDSRAVVLIQIADLLAGAATYKNRYKNEKESAKNELIKHIENCFNINFSKTTNTKYGTFSPFNVFVWDPEVKDENF